jgi:hypothetical protein
MWASLVTVVLLAGLLLWLRAWQHRSRFAIGLAIGAVLALLGGLFLRSGPGFDHIPVWAPALPFAVIAVTLFGFGILAWFWSEDPP